ncbi:MAG: hypothetical protein ABH983_01255 [Candidatus Micrarchaeota archaeon]
MVYISHLKLRNFKSFKAANIQLPSTFICFAGPNGSGKSNLCDAIRFGMGETSLKSLRAKKVKDLIHSGAKSAEVTIVFESEKADGPKYEIRRAIREDGKISYRLNGQKATRGGILETLKRHYLDQSGRNTIAQGEVARIINMNGKERRTIIDSVAGISDFEEKKKEAMKELDLVDDRIKEAQLILGERKAYLEDLGREREIAVKFRGAKESLTNSKGTLLQTEIARLEAELEAELQKEQKIMAEKDHANKELDEVNEEIRNVEIERSKTSEELRSKQKTNTLIRRIEELKAAIGSGKQLIEDKSGFVERISVEELNLEKEIKEEKNAISEIAAEIERLAIELKAAEEKLSSEIGTVEDENLRKIKEKIEQKDTEVRSAKENLISVSSEIESKKELEKAKREEQESIAPGEFKAEESKEDNTELQEQVNSIAREIERSFAKTKEINAQMNDLDRQMLELKEKASIFKIRSTPHLANPAISFINQLKEKEPGIHGTIADLISFDAKHSSAVEAAGGARLLYIVVDNVDIATAAIQKLKAARAGRATFIPMDKVRAPAGLKMDGFSSVLDVIEFPEHIRRAAHYVFADTLLVDEVADAKAVGIGKARIVTVGGEIFERSGIVSGGRSQSGILSGNQARKIENELAGIRSTKESLLAELYSIREEESKLRSEKSQIEIRIKTNEMRVQLSEEKEKDNESVIKRKKLLVQEIANLKIAVEEKISERAKLEELVSERQRELEKLKNELVVAEEEFSKQYEESSDKRANLSGAVSSLRATIEGKRKESELRNEEMDEKEKRVKKLQEDKKESRTKIENAKKQISIDNKEFTELEEKISATSKTIEKLFEKMKAFEEGLAKIGEKRGVVRIKLDKTVKDLNQVEIKKATTTTRLEDMNAEFSSFSEFEKVDASKDALTKMIAEAERTLNSLGNVNMASIEMYDKKRAEIDGVEEKITQLDKEREAILLMINEIEVHKKEAFFEAYEAISDNFKNMFKYVNVGQGHLYLNNPQDPFESGLFIKLRRNNTEHSLDALSGGEKTVVALMFIFALQLFRPSPFYILDEVDAALDKPNSKNLSDLVSTMSEHSQFILVSHNDIVMANSDSVIGVTKIGDISKLVGIKLKQVVNNA